MGQVKVMLCFGKSQKEFQAEVLQAGWDAMPYEVIRRLGKRYVIFMFTGTLEYHLKNTDLRDTWNTDWGK